jgi:hypothetical protein
MRFACRTNKATDTHKTHIHSEHVIHVAFPLQQWLHESASLLRLYANFLSCWDLLFQKTYIPLTLGVLSRCSTHSQIKAKQTYHISLTTVFILPHTLHTGLPNVSPFCTTQKFYTHFSCFPFVVSCRSNAVKSVVVL